VLVVSTHTSGSRDANATSWSTPLGYRLPIVSSRLIHPIVRAGALLLGGLSALSPRIRTLIADAGHESRKLARTLKQNQGQQLRIVNRRQRAFKITGLTWIVERSFSWLGRNRRLSKDYEYWMQTSETMIDLAAIRRMLNRIAPA
jgi:transposase